MTARIPAGAAPFAAFAAFAALACITSSCFDASVPNGAVLFCDHDGACPPGEACDLTSHLCAKPGEHASQGPRVTNATFTPASAKDGAVVTLAIDADVAFDQGAHPPALTFADDGAPAFHVTPASASTHGALTASIDASIPEGFYVVDAIALTSGAAGGASATTPLDGVAFKVDRTPPAISNLDVTAGDGSGGAVVSDQAGTNVVNVTFAVDEPVAASGLSCLIGSAPLACSIGAGLEASCTGTIASGGGNGVVDGENVVLVTATDAAGNESTANAQIAVDLSPPAIVPGSVIVDVDGSSDAPFATVGSSIDLQLLFDETLATDPVLTLTSGETLAVVEHTGAFYRLHGVVAAVAVDGVVGVNAVSTDVFGHGGTESVPLPSPYASGIPVQTTVTSPCTVPPDAGGSTCTDFDGDGFFGPSAGCTPNPVDCDDRDPLTYPGAPEVPGDGKRNDCTDALDLPLDGIHVDAQGGVDNPGRDGSAASPYQSVGFAQTQMDARGIDAPILLAPGSYALDAATESFLAHTVVGGLDPITWQRGAGESRIFLTGANATCGSTVQITVPAVIEGVTFADSLETGGAPDELVDVVVEGCGGIAVNQPLVALRVRDDASLLTFTPAVRLIDSSTVGLQLQASDNLILRSTILATATVQDSADFVDSVVAGTASEFAVECDNCSAVRVYYSNLLGEVGFGAVEVVGSQATDVTLIGSQLRSPAGGATVSLASGQLTMIDDVIDQTGGDLVEATGGTIHADAAGLAEVNQCQFSACVSAGQSVFGTLSLAADLLHQGAAPAGVNQGGDVVFPGSPTSIAGDVDGQCRFVDGHDDVGPDER